MLLRPACFTLGAVLLSACAGSQDAQQAKLWADPPQSDAKPTQSTPRAAAVAKEEPKPELVAAKTVTTPKAPPTCDAHPLCNGESCCTSIALPEGSYRDEKAGVVHVGAFVLDKYELTVGRVEAWQRAGSPVPAEGAVIGHDSAGKPVTWKAGFAVQKGKELQGWARYDTWQTKNAVLPKNFLDWYTAAAVCAMDGGRLPSDAEWRYAAVGGEEDRTYPWGSAPQTPERAIYNCTGNGDEHCSLADIPAVGSRPAGAGRWGHQDLAGSMFEWTADAAGADTAVNRGGGFCYIGGLDRRNEAVRTAANTRRDPPTTLSHMVGARCAYDAPSSSREVAAK